MKSRTRRKTASGVILMLFFSSLFVSALINLSGAETSEHKVLIVDDANQTPEFSSIQAAIEAAKIGDTVYVRSGHYFEHVVVAKCVKLLGENKSSTLIDGNFTGDVVTVAANNVEISGFTIQNSGKRVVTGELPPPEGPFYQGMCGVYVSGCTGANVSGNVVSNNFVGLNFESCSDILISENQIAENYGDCGIRIASSSSVTLSKNTITLNENCGAVVFQCSASTVSENQIIDNFRQGGMVICFLSRFITVTKNNITGNAFHGLNLVNAYENSVFGNTMSSNYYGVCLSGGTGNKVYANYIQANYYGVAFYNSPNDQVYNNELVNNTNDVFSLVPTPSNSSEPAFTPPSSDLSSSQTTPQPDSYANIKIQSPTDGLYQIGLYDAVKNIPLRFTVNEPVSWMAYSLNNEANVTIIGNTTLTISLMGSHTIVVYAKDAEGNTYTSNLVSFKVASTPSVSISSPKNATTYTTSNVPVNIMALAPIIGVEFVEYRVEGTSYSGIINGTQLCNHEMKGSAILSRLPNGNYTLTAVAHAWFTGAMGSSSVYFTVDSREPSASPSQSLSSSQSPTSSLSQSLLSFSSQPLSNNNSVLLMSLNAKENDCRKILMVIVAVVGASLLVFFGKHREEFGIKHD